jgi:hypothetical protein
MPSATKTMACDTPKPDDPDGGRFDTLIPKGGMLVGVGR